MAAEPRHASPINTSLRFGWMPWRSMPRLFQIDVEFVGPLADQRQFERRAVRVGSRRQAIEFEREALDARRSMLEKFGDRQRPVRRWSLDKQIDRFLVGRDHIHENARFTLALDVENGEWIGV